MWSHPIGRLRLIAMLEAISFLLLLGVAMPLKYAADLPMLVRIAGPIHGVLFLALGYMTAVIRSEFDWPLKRAAMIMIASLVPFGPFIIDGRLKREQAAVAT